MPIHSTSALENYTQSTIMIDSGTLEIFYYGTNTGEALDGFIYIYESLNLRNFSHFLYFPSQNALRFNTSSSVITLFYIGPNTNNIVIGSRIQEYHTANCETFN